MDLRPTHRGYAYQDALTAIYLVDVALGEADEVVVDTKLFNGDRFDDVTRRSRDGSRKRIQIKHSVEERALTVETFTTERRSLRVDLLFASLDQDLRDYPGTEYRLVLTDVEPEASDLTAVFTPVSPRDDPGPAFSGVPSTRMKFDPDALLHHPRWSKKLATTSEDLVRRACAQLVVDVNMPGISLDIHSPGPVEAVLLRRVSAELGAGRPPNRDVSPTEVALSLIEAAKAARSGPGAVTLTSLTPRMGLVVDFGAVQEGNPVDPAVAIIRPDVLSDLAEAANDISDEGGALLLTGEPGAGKSWLCEQVADQLRPEWIVARHHCWLGSEDIERDTRVLTEVVIGSLLQQLEAVCPAAFRSIRPRYAATSDALSAALKGVRRSLADRPILLIVDGLDHVTRVLGQVTGSAFRVSTNPARALVDELATVDLPANVVLLIASQPGDHLASLAGQSIIASPLTREDVLALADRHGVLPSDRHEQTETVVDLIHTRSRGNALYATYLCREAEGPDPLGRLRAVPESANDLDSYYRYLFDGLTAEPRMAVSLLAVCDFAVTAQELQEIFPLAPIHAALSTVAPIVSRQPGIGGLKVHHESFSRFIRNATPATMLIAAREYAAAWLARRGFFTDARAFRHLPELLAELGRDDELKALVEVDFVSRAIAGFQPPSALTAVLGTVARRAAALLDWPLLVRCVELRRAVGTYDDNLPDGVADYGDVLVSLLGADTIATGLLYDGELTMPARWGLLLCAAVDRAGGAAPWEAYLAGWQEQQDGNVVYGEETDTDVSIAALRGDLRIAVRRSTEDVQERTLAERVASVLDAEEYKTLDRVLTVFSDCVGYDVLLEAAPLVENPITRGMFLLHLAGLSTDPGVATELAVRAWADAPGLQPQQMLRRGVPLEDIVSELLGPEAEQTLEAATSDVLNDRHPARAVAIGHWLDLLRVAQHHDHGLPQKLLPRLHGVGFYRAWLRFTIALLRLNEDVTAGAVTPRAASAAVRAALEQLAMAAEPFTGKPRACDLWDIRHHVHDTVQAAVALLSGEDLEPALRSLVHISDRTTTSLSGMATTGPLHTTDLLAILSRTVDHSGAATVHTLMRRLREERGALNAIYGQEAEFELEMARISLDAGDVSEAHSSWERAAHLLAAYGSHKDPTIYELLDPLPELATVDSRRTRSCLARIQPFTHLVAARTDGRDTSGTPLAWWRRLTAEDPRAAASMAADILLTEPGLPDSRAAAAHTTLLDEQSDTADTVVLAALRIAAGAEGQYLQRDTALLARLADLPDDDQARSRGALPVIANVVTSTYNDQQRRYTLNADPAPTRDLNQLATLLGGEGVALPLDVPSPKNQLSGRRHARSKIDAVRSWQRPCLPPGTAGIPAALGDHAMTSRESGPDSRRRALDSLVAALGWRLLELAAEGHDDVVVAQLHRISEEVDRLRDSAALTEIAEGLALRREIAPERFDRLAATAFTLAFTRTPGRGGWLTFAGRGRLDLWERAHALDAETASAVLAEEVVATISGKDHYTVGVTQALVAAFSAQRPHVYRSEHADPFSCWDAAFDVIEHRLPGEVDLGTSTYRPEPEAATQADVDSALATLALATVALPDRGDRRRALVAAAVLGTRPELLQAAADRVLAAPIGAGPVTWLLKLLREEVRHGPLTDELVARLTDLTGAEFLSVRTEAASILADAGHTPPPVPATAAHPRLIEALTDTGTGPLS
ncbi:hypothetical protein BS329_17875 [Amycolatopsis coloradensis]|uniref:Orc1-like AAA ATPase domain-containing protein n=1 Tax=Amycolatopsis coloradensis TaxID=76021 RepID=A0A1R0KT37_9PSEU|nr:ATP-binding protein [Amycolatopsis coloradensis]OLZ51110.1 hypothetical protein BS329_17875 [Amycolatopsis coloradensis]